MRRGFFTSSRSYPSETLTASTSSSNVSKSSNAASRRHDIGNKPADSSHIACAHGYTTIWQEGASGLILQSDYRYESPYIGYFPPGSGSPSMLLVDVDVKNVENAMQWSIWTDNPSYPIQPVSERCFTIRSVPDKGLAMIATRKISKGTLIFSERPFFVTIQSKTIAPDMGMSKGGGFHRAAASRLGDSARRDLLALSNCYKESEMDTIPGKLCTNYLPVDIDAKVYEGKSYCGAFATLSRANHSCAPNANYFFEFSDYTGKFFAGRDIAAGEEITCMYTDTLAPHYDRRDSLLSSHHFICMCAFCTLPELGQATSDANRLYLKDMRANLSKIAGVAVSIDELRKAVQIAEKEQIWIYAVQFTFLGGCLLTSRAKNSNACYEGLKWLQKARDGYAMLEGKQGFHVRDIDELINEFV